MIKKLTTDLSTNTINEEHTKKKKTVSANSSTSLADKIKKLAEDGQLSPFLSYCFLVELERRKDIEQKGA